MAKKSSSRIRDEEAAFLDAIVADPEDDTVRLIFADWLEEHDDPRGEFIRVQCILASLDDDDARCPALLRRERELLAAHAKTWLQPLMDLGVDVERAHFERGLIHDLFLTDHKILVDKGEALFRAAPALSQITFFYATNHIVGYRFDVERVAASPYLASLRRLCLEHNGVGSAGASALAASPHLNRLFELVLAHNIIQTEGVRALAESTSLPALERLSVFAGHAEDGALAALRRRYRDVTTT